MNTHQAFDTLMPLKLAQRWMAPQSVIAFTQKGIALTTAQTNQPTSAAQTSPQI